jgi:uncharacterized protein (DUF2147 family)
MRILLASLAASALLGGHALAASDAPNGVWLTQDGSSKIKIGSCGSAYCATVVWVKPLAAGETDSHPAVAGKDLLGTQLSRDLQRKPSGELAGTLLNPENGKTYDVTVKLKNANALEMGGCILGGLLCGSETWTRAPEDIALANPRNASGTRQAKTAPPARAQAAPAAAPAIELEPAE